MIVRSKFRFASFLSITVSVLSGSSSCDNASSVQQGTPQGETQSTTSAKKEKTLIVASDGNIDTFDPAFTLGNHSAQITVQNTFDQLTQYEQVEKTLPNGQTYRTVDTS